jgi:hypothetical protein
MDCCKENVKINKKRGVTTVKSLVTDSPIFFLILWGGTLTVNQLNEEICVNKKNQLQVPDLASFEARNKLRSSLGEAKTSKDEPQENKQ